MSYISSLIKSKILETDFKETDSWIVTEIPLIATSFIRLEFYFLKS